MKVSSIFSGLLGPPNGDDVVRAIGTPEGFWFLGELLF
jgi:hypothetical protein